MKHINFFGLFFFLVSLFSMPLNAQTDAAMKTAADNIINQLAEEGFSLSGQFVFTANEIVMGASTTLFPGNQYKVVLTTDGQRRSSLLIKGGAMTFDVKEELEQLGKELNIGTMPEDFKVEQTGSTAMQEVNMQTVVLPIDYSIDIGMTEADIKADTKLNLLIFYKSSDHIKNLIQKNNDEQHYHRYWTNYIAEKRQAKKETAANPKMEELMRYKATIIKDAAKYGYSLADYQTFSVKAFPKQLETEIHGGNNYLLVLYSGDTESLQIKGTPDKTYNQLAQLTEGMDELQAFEAKKTSNKSTHQIDFRASLYATNYTLNLEGEKGTWSDEPMASFFVFYKSYENMGGAADNKAEDFYTKKTGQALVNSMEEGKREYEATVGYKWMSLEDMVKETETLTSTSPSGLKYMNAKIATDKWMEALVREAHGDGHIYSTFDAMHEDWQKEYSRYKLNATADQLLKELDGGFKQQGFTKDNLVVMDHIIGDKVVTRYYFKIKKCEDYGRIVPKHEIKDGKLHITPWQKAVVPR